METRDYIQSQFDFVHTSLIKVTDGLTADELAWRPGAANPIGWLMLHLTRSEDINIMTRLQEKQQVWTSGKWYEKYHLPAEETTFGWTEEKLAAFKYPDFKDLLVYAENVCAETNKYVAGLTSPELARIVNLSYLGDISIGNLLARSLIHLSGHIGEISYIRGLKRGLNK
jgi:hypothetical protein